MREVQHTERSDKSSHTFAWECEHGGRVMDCVLEVRHALVAISRVMDAEVIDGDLLVRTDRSRRHDLEQRIRPRERDLTVGCATKERQAWYTTVGTKECTYD